jgi:hypothetical protein
MYPDHGGLRGANVRSPRAYQEEVAIGYVGKSSEYRMNTAEPTVEEPWISRCASSARVNNAVLSELIVRFEDNLNRLMGSHPEKQEAVNGNMKPAIIGDVEILYNEIHCTDWQLDRLRQLVNRVSEL